MSAIDMGAELGGRGLGHELPDKVVASYRRTDFFERRRKLMKAWTKYLTAPVAADRKGQR